ncbi:MAG: hypothetical protein H6713_16085 [Myxococcales bacterium]|nr:hypothetical protein [Myxococcales bacterium]
MNLALKTVVIDDAGASHDLRSDLSAPEKLARPYLWHDRGRKLGESIVAYRRWLGRWHAGYVCRRWALEHGGAPPRAVVLTHLEAPMPPRASLDPVQHFWSRVQEKGTLRADCAEFAYAQLDDEVRARHGLPPGPALRTEWARARPPDWATRRAELDPLAPLWPALALALLGAALAWRREELRAARAEARGDAQAEDQT